MNVQTLWSLKSDVLKQIKVQKEEHTEQALVIFNGLILLWPLMQNKRVNETFSSRYILKLFLWFYQRSAKMKHVEKIVIEFYAGTLADLKGPSKAQHFLNFMQFILENLAKQYVGAPPHRRVGAPSYVESGCVPETDCLIL